MKPGCLNSPLDKVRSYGSYSLLRLGSPLYFAIFMVLYDNLFGSFRPLSLCRPHPTRPVPLPPPLSPPLVASLGAVPLFARLSFSPELATCPCDRLSTSDKGYNKTHARLVVPLRLRTPSALHGELGSFSRNAVYLLCRLFGKLRT